MCRLIVEIVQPGTSTGTSILLETNGVSNGSQTILNLKQGTNVTIVDDGVGGVTISSTGGGSGSPASPTNSIQFNNSGAFGGSSNLTWDGTTVAVTGNVNVDSTHQYLYNSVKIAYGNTANNVYFFGNAGNTTTTATNSVGIGNGALAGVTNGQNNTAVGLNALHAVTSGGSNVAIGSAAGATITQGTSNISIGYQANNSVTTGSNNIGIGEGTLLALNATDSGNIALGYYAGTNVTGSNQFFLDNIQQANATNDKAFSLLYGQFASSAGSLTNQQLTVNGKLNVNGTVNINTLTASSVVFTDSSKNLTSTGIGTSAQFIKGDGSLDSNTYQATISLTTTGTSGVATFISNTLNIPNYVTPPGGLNLQVQYNNAGAFGGISGAVTNGTILNLTNPLIGGATITTSTVNGVTLTTGGGTTTFLNANGAYSTPAGTGSGIVRSINSISTPTTAAATAGTDYVYLVTGTTTVTLPTAIGNTNLYTIKNGGTAVVTVATTSAQTIDGNSTQIINTPYAFDFISDGSNWRII